MDVSTAVVSPPPCAMLSRNDLSVDVTIDADAVIPASITEDALTSLAAHVLQAEGASGYWQLGVRFVDDITMQRAHLDFMGIDEPTDIMTFSYEPHAFAEAGGAGEPPMVEHGGDLLISAETALQNATQVGWDQADELRFLVCHGVLHLLGWHDGTDRERAHMLDRQKELLRQWEAQQAG
jgi:probable rRNA maturation factor